MLLSQSKPWAAQAVREKADDPAFQLEWRKMKHTAKVRALAKISAVTGVKLPENALLDVQVRSPAFMHNDSNSYSLVR